MKAIVTWNVGKKTFISLTHVFQPTCENDGTWGVHSQYLPNIINAVKFWFSKISCYTCEWVLQRNMCKHQIVMILACTYII
jgi:hypothetical protein